MFFAWAACHQPDPPSYLVELIFLPSVVLGYGSQYPPKNLVVRVGAFHRGFVPEKVAPFFYQAIPLNNFGVAACQPDQSTVFTDETNPMTVRKVMSLTNNHRNGYRIVPSQPPETVFYFVR
jgi:hypothetical protein